MIRYLPVILLSVMGILLLLVGGLFRLMHWPDLFRGTWSGPGLLVIAGVWFFIIRIRQQKSNK